MGIDVPVSIRCFSDAYLLPRSCIWSIVGAHVFIVHRRHHIWCSRERGIHEQRLRIILGGVTRITLGSIGLTRDPSDGLGALRGELNFPSVHILPGVLKNPCRPSKDSRLIWSKPRTHGRRLEICTPIHMLCVMVRVDGKAILRRFGVVVVSWSWPNL
jgi:hypothetical protein